MERTLWVDVLLLALISNFLFDYLLLWASAEVSRLPTSRKRLTLGALIGTAYFAAYLLARAGVLPYFRALSLIPVVLLVSAGMVAVTFRGAPWRRLVAATGYFYLIGFAAAGAGMGAAFVVGSPSQPHVVAGFFVAVASILLMAELGWGVVQRRLWLHVFQLPVSVRFGGDDIQLTALVDTGNRLRDPLSGHPVMVVEVDALEPVLPPGLAHLIRQGEKADLDALAQAVAGTPWAARLRIIPYHSIDREHGMLIGFRPDELTVRSGSDTITAQDAVVGICRQTLDPEGAYQALVHPELVQEGLAPAGHGRSEAGRPVVETEDDVHVERSASAHASAHPPL